GHICKELGDLAQAETLLSSAFEVEKKTLGPDHPACGSTLHQLGALYWKSSRWQEGAEATDQMLKVYRKHTRRALAGLSESEQVQFLAKIFEQDFAFSLSLAQLERTHYPPLVEKSAEWLINGKALKTQALHEQNLVNRDFKDPSLRELARQLRSVRT